MHVACVSVCVPACAGASYESVCECKRVIHILSTEIYHNETILLCVTMNLVCWNPHCCDYICIYSQIINNTLCTVAPLSPPHSFHSSALSR